jgi:hypothetical protein
MPPRAPAVPGTVPGTLLPVPPAGPNLRTRSTGALARRLHWAGMGGRGRRRGLRLDSGSCAGRRARCGRSDRASRARATSANASGSAAAAGLTAHCATDARRPRVSAAGSDLTPARSDQADC